MLFNLLLIPCLGLPAQTDPCKEFQPICGQNGVLYSNRCSLEFARTTVSDVLTVHGNHCIAYQKNEVEYDFSLFIIIMAAILVWCALQLLVG